MVQQLGLCPEFGRDIITKTDILLLRQICLANINQSQRLCYLVYINHVLTFYINLYIITFSRESKKHQSKSKLKS